VLKNIKWGRKNQYRVLFRTKIKKKQE
jgi:hypothetical protein